MHLTLGHRPDKQVPKLGFAIRMARRSGTAILPLHGGRVPPWLASRMSSLGAIITQAIVHHYGRDEFLQRLSHPFWFQSFGRAASPTLDGRSVFGWEKDLARKKA